MTAGKPINRKKLSEQAIILLQQLIATPSFSREEKKTADLLEEFLQSHHLPAKRKVNNVWSLNQHFREHLPTILLNSHHDTVKPNAGYTLNPFEPIIKDGKLYGLGSNDAGGALVSLLAAFLYFYNKPNLPFNLLFAASAEEEISGANGISLMLPELGKIDFALVGEPTGLNLAIAEKGLMVLDCTVYGKAAHAAGEEGDNAIYKAMQDIAWFRSFAFPKVSSLLGPVKMSVTLIHSGTQHNVIPDKCEFTVDVRTTDAYTNEEILDIIIKNNSCDIKPRSLRLKPSSISPYHPIVQAGIQLGRTVYGSSTLSDKALMPFPSLKIGPGDAARSHTADEFIFIHEIEAGIDLYIQMIESLNING